MYKRYWFVKQLFKDYLVILKKQNHFISFNIDNEILDYLVFTDDFSLIDRYHINYIVVDNLEIINNKSFKNNNYFKYMYLCKLLKIIELIL